MIGVRYAASLVFSAFTESMRTAYSGRCLLGPRAMRYGMRSPKP